MDKQDQTHALHMTGAAASRYLNNGILSATHSSGKALS
jgi:hypothetical protein